MKNCIIINDNNEFYGGNYFHEEYPEAILYSMKEAIKIADTICIQRDGSKERLYVCEDYGLDSENDIYFTGNRRNYADSK